MNITGLVFINKGNEILEIPRNKISIVKINKLPQYEFFAFKDGRTWYVYETNTGLNLGGNSKTRAEAIEFSNIKVNEALAKDKNYFFNVIKKNALPKKYLDELKNKKDTMAVKKTKAVTAAKTRVKKASTALRTATKKVAVAKKKVTAVKKTYVKLVQTGSSSKKADAKRTALKPGKRLSASGSTYYEYRANRSDLKPRKKGSSL